jgi:hypothetical protein
VVTSDDHENACRLPPPFTHAVILILSMPCFCLISLPTACAQLLTKAHVTPAPCQHLQVQTSVYVFVPNLPVAVNSKCAIQAELRIQLWQADRDWEEAVQSWNAVPFSTLSVSSLEDKVNHFHRLTLMLQAELPPNKVSMFYLAGISFLYFLRCSSCL